MEQTTFGAGCFRAVESFFLRGARGDRRRFRLCRRPHAKPDLHGRVLRPQRTWRSGPGDIRSSEGFALLREERSSLLPCECAGGDMRIELKIAGLVMALLTATAAQGQISRGDRYSGVPWATISPPSSPASGPRSISQSADFITSRLCSTTTSE